jgi:hypothetical protein
VHVRIKVNRGPGNKAEQATWVAAEEKVRVVEAEAVMVPAAVEAVVVQVVVQVVVGIAWAIEAFLQARVADLRVGAGLVADRAEAAHDPAVHGGRRVWEVVGAAEAVAVVEGGDKLP